MSRLLVIFRLASRDLRRRPLEAALLLLAMTAATTTLAIGLVLHGVTDQPYERTRTATAGPDVVAQADPPENDGSEATSGTGKGADLAALKVLATAPGVVGHSGPYPLAQAPMDSYGGGIAVAVEGRNDSNDSVDRPKVTDGRWIRDGGVVLERSFAEALRVEVGDTIVVKGSSMRVDGIAVTAAVVPFPSLTLTDPAVKSGSPVRVGLAWATVPDARALASDPADLSYVMNLKLADPATAPAFTDRHSDSGPGGPSDAAPVLMQSWQQIGEAHANLAKNERRALLTGSWLLDLLALASIAVLVGGRMAAQNRRVGLLKAVGAMPALIASVLLAEYLLVAAAAAIVGLTLAQVVAPSLAKPGAGLLGDPGKTAITPSTIVIVMAIALVVVLAATLVPSIRAARTSTVLALADAARPPRRSAALIAFSARLPVPLLLGMRLAARRPRRALLGVASIAITVAGIVAVLAAHAQLTIEQGAGTSTLVDPRTERLSHILTLITVVLLIQAAVNAIFITWANVLDARRSSTLARALGATPWQVSVGISAAQVIPALAGAVLGIPAGLALISAVSPDKATIPSPGWLLVTLLGAPLAMAALTALPARASAHRPVAAVLRSELA